MTARRSSRQPERSRRTYLKLIDDTQAKVEQALSTTTDEMLASKREFVGNESTGAGMLAVMIRHLGEHLGHVALTRQLWEQLEAASS